MAARIPTIRKSWRFVTNSFVSAGTDLLARASLLFAMHQRLIALPSLTWTGLDGATAAPPTGWSVRGSSNGTVANTSNNWTTAADLVWAVAPIAHSWIVYRFTDYFSAGQHLEMCIDCSQASASDRNAAIGIIFSRTGFTMTGLVTTGRPTAADERVVFPSNSTLTNATWQGSGTNNTEALGARLHYCVSDDGRHWRFIVQRAGNTNALLELFLPDDAPSGWTRPYIFRAISTASQVEALTVAATLINTTFGVRNYGHDSVVGAFTLAESVPVVSGAANSIVGAASTTYAQNTFDSSRPMEPIGLYAVTTAVGKMAVIPDLWLGIAADATGDHANGDLGVVNQFAAAGDYWIPWDRSVMLST